MTTPRTARCKKCSYCIYDRNETLVCSEHDNKPIEDIPDEECPIEQEA